MSAIALDTHRGELASATDLPDAQSRLAGWLRYADLPVLALALPVFVIASLPMLGYLGCASAWLFAKGLQFLAARQTVAALGRGDRRSAMGFHAAAMMARIWIVALAVLAVGLIEREAGLSAAVLAAVLVTFHLGGGALSHLLTPQPPPRSS